mgnify:FL=1
MLSLLWLVLILLKAYAGESCEESEMRRKTCAWASAVEIEPASNSKFLQGGAPLALR